MEASSDMDLDAKLSYVTTREDLAEFIRALGKDLNENSEDWENPTLERYLNAMAAWVASMDGLHKNTGMKIQDANWHTLGQILLAARIYE